MQAIKLSQKTTGAKFLFSKKPTMDSTRTWFRNLIGVCDAIPGD
jgi:hypothetical protein